jgi:tRNA G26 N,N-dimethylase Trm1
MYLIIRCCGCRTFTYVDRYQQWKLCPHCGETISVAGSPVYLEVEEFTMAENIIRQLQKHLDTSRKKDLSPDEIIALRHQYAEWLRSRV